MTIPDRESFLDRLAVVMYHQSPFTSLKVAIREDLSIYSDELLLQLEELFKVDNAVTQHVKVILSMKQDEGMVRDFMLLVPTIPHMSYYGAYDTIQSLRSYHQLPQTQYFHTLEEEDINKCRALLKAAESISAGIDVFETRGDISSGFKDSKLVDLIISHPAQVETIINIINDRNSGEVDLIKSVLDFETSALKHGVL